MSDTFTAVYEDGVLRPTEPVRFDDGVQLELMVVAVQRRPPEFPAEILARIAALSIEGHGDPHTARDHDQVLYGGK